MIFFPQPRIFYVIALITAIPTYGISLLVFYFFLKRPYDSRATSLILANANMSLKTGTPKTLYRINRAAVERVFWKFALPEKSVKYGTGDGPIRWGVIVHPMINDGNPFTLRVKRNGGQVEIEALDGEVWYLLSPI